MDDPRHFARRSAMLLLGLTAICIVALGAVALLRPRSFANHDELIGYILEQRGIAYEQIRLSQDWRDTQNFYAYTDYSYYGADVEVNLPDGQVALGRIDCRVKRTKCYLSLVKLGITYELLPELVSDDRQAWWSWVKRKLAGLRLPGLSPEPSSSSP